MATRKAASAPIACVVCGKMFVPTSAAKTCGPECSWENSRANAEAWDHANRAARAARRRQQRKAKKEKENV